MYYATTHDPEKPFKIVVKHYQFSKETRKLFYPNPPWQHHRNYKTLEGAMDALRDFRSQSHWRDYPGDRLEERYPHIRPSINIYRYKIQFPDAPKG